MAGENNEKIKRALNNSNPWWRGEWDKEFKKRQIESKIDKYMDKRQMISITGLRRAGKTTLFYRTINKLLKKEEPENIIYFSFDDFPNAEPSKILEQYKIIQKKENIRKERHYLFLDEIQKLKNWQEKVKRLYDNYENLKILLSGSESLFIRKKSKESLAGRIFEFQLSPLNFKEYLQFKGINTEKPELYKTRIRTAFNHYMLTSGFPELVEAEDESYIKRYIKEAVVDRVIFKDIPEIFPIDNPIYLESIVNILISNPCQILSPNSLARDLDITRQTTSKYLKYLEMSYIIKKAYNYTGSRKKQERKLKKYYLKVPSLALIERKDREMKSKVFENLIALQTGSGYFWRTPQKKEVDIILEKDNKPIPIEVKYKNKKEYSGLLDFMERYNLEKGTVVTEDLEDREEIDGKIIEYIPAWKYLIHHAETDQNH